MAEANVPERTLVELWKERQYMAFVNFLQKRNMYDEWKLYKADNRNKDMDRLMLEFLKRKQAAVGGKA